MAEATPKPRRKRVPTLGEQILDGETTKPERDPLEEQLDRDYAPAWRPDQGDPDRIIGTVVELGERTNPFRGGNYAIVTLELDDGSFVAVHCVQTVLASAMKRVRPKIGDRIGVERKGERQSQAGRKPYRDFRVVKDQKPGEDFWSRVQDEAEEEF